jgi:hypothetical protein
VPCQALHPTLAEGLELEDGARLSHSRNESSDGLHRVLSILATSCWQDLLLS